MNALETAIYRAKVTPPPPQAKPIISVPIRDELSELIAQQAERIKELEAEVTRLKQRRPLPIEPGLKTYPSVRGIAQIVAEYFEITFADIISRRRTQRVCIPRHIAIYLARTMTACSFPEIARRFDNRDHTVAIHSYEKIKGMRIDNAEINTTVAEIEQIIAVNYGASQQ